MTMNTWSQTASSNSSADATINWTEGQAPSSVNDSARAMMAAAAKYRDDNSGSLTTGGSSTAYTVTSNQVFASLSAMNGMSLRVKFNATNGAAPTLNVDGLGAKALVTVAGTALPTGSIVSGTVHNLVYDNGNSCWIVCSVFLPAFDAGTKMLFQQTAAPTGWTKDTTHNDKALRVVTGTASSGGSTAFSSVMAARTITQANLPSVNFTGALPNHTHSFTAVLTHSTQGSGGASGAFLTATASVGTTDSGSGGTVSVSSGGSGTAMDFAVQYVDLIIATKS